MVLNRGVIEQVGSPLELYNKPDSLFVAGFIGSPKMNFLMGEEATRRNASTIGIRPEHIDLRAGSPWQGRIQFAEHLGADTFLHVELPSGSKIVVRTDGNFAGQTR